MSAYGTPTRDCLFCRNLAVLWYNSEVNHWSVLVSLGIPIQIGRNRSQPVFASWYDDVNWLLERVRKGEELKAPRHASAAALCDDYVTTYDIIPNTIYTYNSFYYLYYFIILISSISTNIIIFLITYIYLNLPNLSITS